MDVLDAADEIVLVADGMLPKALLPDGALTVGGAVCRSRAFSPVRPEVLPRERLFDLSDAQRVRTVARRQHPNPMNMIRQPDPGELREWPLATNGPDCF